MDHLDAPDHVAELWHAIQPLGTAADQPDDPETAQTSRGVVVAVGPDDHGRWHVSLSHPQHDVHLLAYALGGLGIQRGTAATHCSVSATGTPGWLLPDYFKRT